MKFSRAEEIHLAPRTLADMSPKERAECRWMQAEDDVGNHVIITELDEENQEGKVLYENGGQFGWSYEILVPLPHLPRMEWPGNEQDDGETVAESENVEPGQQALARDIFGSFPPEERHVHWAKPIPEPASPRPEDVPEGETWLIRPYENADPAPAFRVHASKYGPGKRWAYFRVGGSMIGFADDEDVTLIARLVPEATDSPIEPVFDPDYIYRDRIGNEWSYVIRGWRCYSTATGKLLASHFTPPDRWGPYTRIEE